MTYKTLLFDLDDTLLDFAQSEHFSLNKLYHDYFSVHVDNAIFTEKYHRINKKLWSLVELGETTAAEVKLDRFRLLTEALNSTIDYRKLATAYEGSLGEQCGWLVGAEEALTTLKNHYQIGIITNGLTSVQTKKYTALELHRFCECYLISEAVGIAKPDKEIFTLALEHFKSASHETLMIGDSLASDYQGALNADIDFCWINSKQRSLPTNLPPPKHTIGSVAELPSLIASFIY